MDKSSHPPALGSDGSMQLPARRAPAGVGGGSRVCSFPSVLVLVTDVVDGGHIRGQGCSAKMLHTSKFWLAPAVCVCCEQGPWEPAEPLRMARRYLLRTAERA